MVAGNDCRTDWWVGLSRGDIDCSPCVRCKPRGGQTRGLDYGGHAEAAGLLTTDVFAQHYDLRTSAAVQRWLSDLPVDLHEAVQSTIEDAACAAKVWWDTASSGQESGHPDRGNEEEVPHYQGGPSLIIATGAEDAEHPSGHAEALAV